MLERKSNMAINFSDINLEVIDIAVSGTPDIVIGKNKVTFKRRVLEDLNYPQTVQYCVDAEKKIFAVRACKGNETKATAFSKATKEKATELVCNNKNLVEVITAMIPDYDPDKRYKVTGEFDAEVRIVYFDLSSATAAATRRKRK